jgi:capsid protein
MAGFTDLSRSPILNAIKGIFGGKPEPVQTPAPQPVAYHHGNRNFGNFGGGASKFHNGMSTAYPVIRMNHTQLRMQARAAMQDSVEARSIVESKANGIAGTGLKYEPTPDISVLGITQEEAAVWAKSASARFSLFMNDKKQNRSETMTGNQGCRFWAWSKERDNDVFVRLYYSPERTLQNPLQFEFIDPDQIRGDALTVSYGIQYTDDGIIRDTRGRETAFKVWTKGENGTLSPVTIQKKGPKSGRIFMLHGFSQEYAGQGRGFTKLAPILQDLQELSNFKLAHIAMATNQATMTAWVVPSDDEDAQQLFENQMTNGGAGAYIPPTTGADEPSAITPQISDFNCYVMPEATIGQPSMMIQNLTKGADIKFGNPSTGAQYDKFVDSFFTNLAALTGEPIEVVQMKFGNSFSASRGTLLLRQVVLLIERADEAADFLNPLLEMWMSGEIAAGRITAPGWSDPRLRAAWLKASWRGAPVPDIDPGKLAKARKDNLDTAATNIDKEAQEHSGVDADVNIAINNLAYENYKKTPWNVDEEPVAPDDDSDEKE